MASVYTAEQVKAWLEFIGITNLPSDVLTAEFLRILHVHQISTIPYENLSLHYSQTKQVSLDPHELYDKIMVRKRGGYCMETSLFYNHMLRGLGFTAYTAGVTIRRREGVTPVGAYIGWIHVVNIVTLPDGTKWMIDVGFGGDGATKPLPLIDGATVHNLGMQEIRLIRDKIPEQVNPEQLYWIYQYRNSPESEWNSYYAFPGVEFSVADFGIINWWACNCPQSFQTFTVLIVKFYRGDDKIVGKVMLINDTIKRNMGGRTEVVAVLKSESERIAALSQWFNLELTQIEQDSISGHVTEIVR